MTKVVLARWKLHIRSLNSRNRKPSPKYDRAIVWFSLIRASMKFKVANINRAYMGILHYGDSNSRLSTHLITLKISLGYWTMHHPLWCFLWLSEDSNSRPNTYLITLRIYLDYRTMHHPWLCFCGSFFSFVQDTNNQAFFFFFGSFLVIWLDFLYCVFNLGLLMGNSSHFLFFECL